jgi:hypothetical protein
MKRNRRTLNQKGEGGAVLVELAIILPLLALIFLTIIDLGLVIREHQVLQNAAREGARFSTLPMNWINPRNPGASEASIKQRVIDYCWQEGLSVNMEDVTLNQTYPIDVGGLTAYGSEVTVTYEGEMLIPGAPLIPVGQLNLTGRAVFRNLY